MCLLLISRIPTIPKSRFQSQEYVSVQVQPFTFPQDSGLFPAVTRLGNGPIALLPQKIVTQVNVTHGKRKTEDQEWRHEYSRSNTRGAFIKQTLLKISREPKRNLRDKSTFYDL